VDGGFQFNAISVFAGCGGSSLGYTWAGGKVLLAIDHDADAVATYRANFIDTPVYHGDIADLGVEECCRLAGIRPGDLDILDGSPPCQGFSLIGTRRFLDPRNQLFLEFVRLLRGLQPKAFVMENVRGMVAADMRLIFADCLERLKAAGYRVRARLLNTKYFNVPQDRERIIFVGFRDDLGIEPSHPRAQSRPQSIRQVLGLVGEGGVKSNQFKSGWRSLDEPCVTIFKHPPLLSLDGVERKLTFDECTLLQGFPDDWKWPKKIQRYLGNAVPPPFMKAVAQHVKDNILAVTGGLKTRQPQEREYSSVRHTKTSSDVEKRGDRANPAKANPRDSQIGRLPGQSGKLLPKCKVQRNRKSLKLSGTGQIDQLMPDLKGGAGGGTNNPAMAPPRSP